MESWRCPLGSSVYALSFDVLCSVPAIRKLDCSFRDCFGWVQVSERETGITLYPGDQAGLHSPARERFCCGITNNMRLSYGSCWHLLYISLGYISRWYIISGQLEAGSLGRFAGLDAANAHCVLRPHGIGGRSQARVRNHEGL